MPFKDRADAGRKLARALAGYKDEQPVLLALPRGGVSVAAVVAAVLKAPLDLILVRKIGVPIQPELAMGAVVDGIAPIIVRNENVIELADIDESTFKAICDSELAEIERRRQRYLGNRQRAEISGHTAIVIDDGHRHWRDNPRSLACYSHTGRRGAVRFCPPPTSTDRSVQPPR